MGALPRLKKKLELHYRKGSTNEARNCQFCSNLVEKFEIEGIGEPGSITREPRCKIMGLMMSRRYRIRLDHTCDAQVYVKPAWMKQGEGNHV